MMTVFDVQINDRGQVTIPKELRDRANLAPQETLKIQLDTKGRLILYKKDIFDDLEDLIRRDLIKDGYTSYDFDKMLPIRKKELADSLYKMVEESSEQINQGEFTTLEDLKKEFEDEKV
jgi:AbrB family looped-hinge helix DNA binding protein